MYKPKPTRVTHFMPSPRGNPSGSHFPCGKMGIGPRRAHKHRLLALLTTDRSLDFYTAAPIAERHVRQAGRSLVAFVANANDQTASCWK